MAIDFQLMEESNMYTISPSSADIVIELTDIPQSSVGAPCPAVIADEHHLSVIFYLEDTANDWDGTTVRIVSPDSVGESIAVISFSRALAYYHGMPNDEAFSGHPLYHKGLHAYSAFEVLSSTWRNHLMEMNRVHPYHRDEKYARFRHFVLAFHDSTFECIAESYSVITGTGSIREFARQTLDNMA